jgi:membrane protease YdiL (CAAX protease family)
MVPAASGFLIECALFLAAATQSVRARLDKVNHTTVATTMSAIAGLTYLISMAPSGQFHAVSFTLVLLIAAAGAFWFLVLPRSPVTDLAYIALSAALILAGVFGRLYPETHPKVPLAFIGEVMWIRTGVIGVLLFRRMDGVEAGLVPSRSEWAVGFYNYLWFVPLGIVLALSTDFARPRPLPTDWPRFLLNAVAIFAGMLWFVAFREEFFFRGLLQQWLSGWLRSDLRGLLLASVLFGLVHLPFGQFPNWRFVLLATVAGFFYGRAFQQGRGIRAAMVTHALVNTTWRVFLT